MDKTRHRASRHHVPATPEAHLSKLRKAQHEDHKKIKEIDKRIKDRGDDIDRWRKEDKHVEALHKHDVESPWVVLSEADRAEAKVGGLDVNFRVILIAILRQETGIPQRNIFGCDHGPQGGQPPFCQDRCTKGRVNELVELLRDGATRFQNMNGVGWTQLTWYEKVLRCDNFDGGASIPRNQVRVGAEDLAQLIKSYGQAEGIRRYNGSGPSAEAYRDSVINVHMPWARQALGG